MSSGRILKLVLLAVVVVVAVSCVSSCRKSRIDRLWVVGVKSPEPHKSAKKSLVVVTHGWIKKGRGGWPEDMALAIRECVDGNEWFCGYFDWAEGAATLNATDAARYARDTAGPGLAEEIVKLSKDFEHIHLIGHSSGCWAVSEAAKILAEKAKADIHLTFFDAYVSVFWDESSLGDVNAPAAVNCWVEHYYTRDYTLGWTQRDLSCAHNVDVTNIDPGLKDHNFPWRWYLTTVKNRCGKGGASSVEPTRSTEGVEYGFVRSREADVNGWIESLELATGNKAVKIRKRRE